MPPGTETFPPDNPYPVTSVDFVQFSTTAPFVQQFRLLLRDAAAERGKVLQVGEYHLTTRCFDEFAIEVLGTFTGGLIFDTPTHYSVIPDPTPTPATPAATPTPTPTPSPTPTPVPGAVDTLTALYGIPSFPHGANLTATVVPLGRSSRTLAGSVSSWKGPLFWVPRP